jgi:hypothetical protein
MNFGTRGCMYCEGECNKECLLQEEPKAERSYSEEEVLKILSQFNKDKPKLIFGIKEWFEQHKKK